MPSTSEKQRKLFGLALSVKRGETPRSEVSEDILKIVDTMTEDEIRDFAISVKEEMGAPVFPTADSIGSGDTFDAVSVPQFAIQPHKNDKLFAFLYKKWKTGIPTFKSGIVSVMESYDDNSIDYIWNVFEEDSKGSTSPDREVFDLWKENINMSASELQKYYDSETGKDSGLSRDEAKDAGIDTGRESAKMIIKMLDHNSWDSAEKNWTPTMWKWARKQNSFIARMLGMKSRIKGDPYEKDGKPTRWLMSLLIWGHDPRK